VRRDTRRLIAGNGGLVAALTIERIIAYYPVHQPRWR
jgi:hypothetical protein